MASPSRRDTRTDVPPVNYIVPDWPAPVAVRAVSTTRAGGYSAPPFDGLNLSFGVGDVPERVSANRRLIKKSLGLPAAPHWLRQVHGDHVVTPDPHAEPAAWFEGCEADGCISRQPETVCAVLTADCLPVLICNREGSCVAAAHAGWRGLLRGILGATVNAFAAQASELMAWIGPGIGAAHFEVGDEVRAAFLAKRRAYASAFTPSPAGRWMADLPQLARLELAQAGVEAVYGGQLCTYADARDFFSYRREHETGRMATLIWRTASK